MRPLTLHASALSDSEYILYTSSLNDLCVSSDTDPTTTTTAHNDAHYETMAMGVREVRAWFKGRYQVIPASDIDVILKLFHPNLLPTDTLTGGQFFAALRLVLHAQSGNGVDRSLAFVQAHTEADEHGGVPRPSSPPKCLVKPPPSHHGRSSIVETNPFARRSAEQSVARRSSPSADSDTTPPQKISQNPFMMRDQKHPERPISQSSKLPPLPPRKSTLVPSQQPPEPSMTPFGASLAPLKPTHVTSPLMKQSLEASKQGQNLKRAEEQLDQERVLRVLKTTSRTRSPSPSKSALEPTRTEGAVSPLLRQRPPSGASSSGSSSLASLDKVASTTLPSAAFPPPLPSREPTNTGPMPAPPTHPDRRPPPIDPKDPPPTSRVSRSKSLDDPDAPPVPPPARRRPESVQLPTTLFTTDTSLPALPPWQSSHLHKSSTQGLSRHLSLMRARDTTDSSPMSNIQKTISNLQLKAQPKLDAVRYKAEAGISKRGYVNHAHLGVGSRWCDEGEEGLMADTRWGAASVDPYSDPVTDDEPGFGDTREDRFGHGNSHLKEADNLKWPVGEGWTQL